MGEIGDVVNCIIEEDPRNPGKYCAKQVQQGGIVEVAGEDGVVDSWNTKGGFGFLRMDDGRRAYIHASFVGGGGCDLEVGTRLTVRTKPDPRNAGKFSVAEVLSGLDISGGLGGYGGL